MLRRTRHKQRTHRAPRAHLVPLRVPQEKSGTCKQIPD